jgi:cytochrome c-type biogenesis protein CcmH
LPGAPVPAKATTSDATLDQTASRQDLIGKVGGEADTLAQADAYFRIDRPDLAARVIRLALEKSPNSPGLWTGLGNAMVGHSRGMLSPAAEYCYRRALRLAPDYPGALYFYGLALAENGRTEEAKPIFVALVRQLPADAPMRARLVADLTKAGLLTAQEAVPNAPTK